jgi:hypothetical protein
MFKVISNFSLLALGPLRNQGAVDINVLSPLTIDLAEFSAK